MNNKNGYREEKPCCYFHPKQQVVGVCPLCLNERLIILAATQNHHNKNRSSSKASNKLQNSVHIKPSSSIHRIFAFGSLFTRQEWKSDSYDCDVASPSPEDSFISIKFEDNGVASWEKSTVSKVPLENCNNKMSWNHHQDNNNKGTTTKSVIEHGKSRDAFRWRKRIGHVFHLIRWKKGAACHVAGGVSTSNKVEGVKVRKGWIMRTLTKRKKSME